MLSKLSYLILFLSCFLSLEAQSEFQFWGKAIAPGAKAHFVIPISDARDSTFIPITVFHGNQEGPVLGITAGVHGYEYPPIMAGQALIKQIDPTQLSGTLILVQAANVGSFLGRSPFVNPLDGKNLNRIFPGKKEGSVTERIAHWKSKPVILTDPQNMDELFNSKHCT